MSDDELELEDALDAAVEPLQTTSILGEFLLLFLVLRKGREKRIRLINVVR